MLRHFYEDFMSFVPLQLPQLLNVTAMEEPLFYNDYALLTFNMTMPIELEEVMDILEDDMQLIMLYNHIPSQHTKFGQGTCFYSNPSFGQMFKINAMTDDTEMVSCVKVTIYDSLEKMCADVNLDMRLHTRSGHFRYRRNDSDVLMDFL